MIALLALLALLGSSVLAEHNDHAPPPTWNSSIWDDDVVPDDDIYPDPDARYEHGAPTAEWIPASYQIGEEAFDLAFQASANGIIRVDMWGYYRVYYRRVTDREKFRPYFYIFNNWNTFRNETRSPAEGSRLDASSRRTRTRVNTTTCTRRRARRLGSTAPSRWSAAPGRAMT